MQRAIGVSRVIAPQAAPAARQLALKTAVGASYSFEPAVDGLPGIYANRLLERGVDPRALCAEVRADRLGALERIAAHRTLLSRSRTIRIGRGTSIHLMAAQTQAKIPPEPAADTPRRTAAVARPRRSGDGRWPRRLAAVGLAILLLLPISVIVANAQEVAPQARYVVQPDDTLEGVAAEFGVDPAAILAASALQNPPYLTPSEIIVIPASGESPDAAAWNAAQQEGSSPFVAGAHNVAAGETLASIAAFYGVDPWALAPFNGMSDVDTLYSGQQLRIPAVEAFTVPETEQIAEPSDTWVTEEQSAQEPVGAIDWSLQEPATGPIFAAEVPAYLQAYPLSCEYAAAYIATAGLGWGVPESAFMERIGQAANPHWGYRGSITGGWGGSDDYGVYPEAMVPTLNEFGYAGDIFYGGDAASLTARIDVGMPVLTWLGYFGDTAWVQEDEGAYLLAPGMHVVTVYGYDDGGVFVSNPGRGNFDYYDWETFLAMWQVLDGMALGIAPL